MLTARPIQAVFTSAATFAFGAALPIVVAILSPMAVILLTVSGGSLLFLAFFGSMATGAGGASVIKAATRVTF